MEQPRKTSLKDWYSLHEYRRTKLTEKKAKQGLSELEEALLVRSVYWVLELVKEMEKND